MPAIIQEHISIIYAMISYTSPLLMTVVIPGE
jgi:hypothetical protein